MRTALAVVALLVPGNVVRGGEISGELALEGRGFPGTGLDDQDRASGSLRLEPELVHDWDGGDQRIAVALFGRVDSGDAERTHFDIREAYWRRTFGGSLDLYLGLRRVFWGITESAHLVDIINQTDLVENLDTEDKLGQPMLSVAWARDWGSLELFLLPFFRERTFPGSSGRLRTPLVVDTENPVFASGAAHHHLDLALRWSHYIGDFDIGVSHFSGTAREPVLLPDRRPDGAVLVPCYGLLDQTGLDVQYTRDDTAYKLEVVSRESDGNRSTGLVGGVEYTVVGILGSSTDLGLIAEYQYDDRRTPTIGDHDLVAGGRLTFNDVQDTDLLAFAVVDTEDGSLFASLEGNRRLGMNWELEIEARMFVNADEKNPLRGFRNDDYVQVELIRYY